MTDFEMTKLCAEAMGHRSDKDGGYSRLAQGAGMDEPQWFEFIYDPFHDDAQAMALVKKFGLWIGYDLLRGEIAYIVEVGGSGITLNHDLNRAIVECVAKLQSAA